MKKLTRFLGDFQHFLEDGGGPVRLTPQREELIKMFPDTFTVVDGCVRMHGKFPDKVLAAYWKFRLKEERDLNCRLIEKIDELNRIF
jgi:hypothetical protein